MKRRLIALLIVFTAFAACKKTYCWKCTTTQTMFYRNGTQTSNGTSETQTCGLSGADARDYEKLGSQTTKTSEGSLVTVRTCERSY